MTSAHQRDLQGRPQTPLGLWEGHLKSLVKVWVRSSFVRVSAPVDGQCGQREEVAKSVWEGGPAGKGCDLFWMHGMLWVCGMSRRSTGRTASSSSEETEHNVEHFMDVVRTCRNTYTRKSCVRWL